MFDSNELLHLVFADETDTYYYNGLLELDLKQALWFGLHEKHFRSVYFMDVRGEDCYFRHFGDSAAQNFPVEEKSAWIPFGKQKSKAERLGAWLEDRLRGKTGARAAVVCPLKMFCGFFDDENRIAILRRLAELDHRTGILVLTAPPEAEETRDLLLHSPVFGPDALQEYSVMAVRGARTCQLYHALAQELRDRCAYLNIYTEERLRSVVRRLLLTDPKKCGTCADLSLPAAYLFQYMNNEPFRLAEEAQGLRLPKTANLSFRQLYDHFSRMPVWETLTRRLEAVEQAGGLAAWCEENGLPLCKEPPDAVGVRHKSNSCAARCLALKLPKGEPGPRLAEAGRRLKEIRDAVSDPKNRDENPKIAAGIEHFLGETHSLRSTNDVETQYRVLEAIAFCLQWLYAEPGSEDEEKALRLIGMLKTYLSLSSQYHGYQQIDSGAAQTVAMKKMLDAMEIGLRDTLKQVALPTKESLEKFASDLREFENTGNFKPDGAAFEFEHPSGVLFNPDAVTDAPDLSGAPEEPPDAPVQDAQALPEDEDEDEDPYDFEPTEDDFDPFK